MKKKFVYLQQINNREEYDAGRKMERVISISGRTSMSK